MPAKLIKSNAIEFYFIQTLSHVLQLLVDH